MQANKITLDLIKSFDPCYNPGEIGMRKNYEAKISDFIIEYRDKVKKKFDIQWTLVRTEFMPENDLKLFAIWCARQVQHLMTDQRSIIALDVAEKYVYGLATKKEMMNAYEDARRAAYAAMAARGNKSAMKAAYAAMNAVYVAFGRINTDAAMAAAGFAMEASGYANTYNQIDKLLYYFLTVESGKEYDWRKSL